MMTKSTFGYSICQSTSSIGREERYAALTQMLPTLSVNGQLSRQANCRGDTGSEWNTLDAWSAGGAVSVTLFRGEFVGWISVCRCGFGDRTGKSA